MAQTDIGIRLSLDGQAAVSNGLRQVEGSMGGLSKATDLVGASFKSLAATAAAGLSVRAFVQAADAVTILNNQLKLATGSTQAASKAYTALFDIAQRSRVSFTELGGTFASISRAGEALGISQTRLLAITESISNAVAISGGSAESARASLVQLSQGLASGTLRGDELNSVMEQTPRLAKALADGLGVSTGELRKMGEQGKITASAVIGALESQAKVLSGEVKNSVVTVGQAFTQLQNATVLAVGEFDKASGVSNTLATALQGVAGVVQTVGAALKDNQTAIQTTAGALAGLASVAIVGKLAAVATGIGGVSGALVILRGVVASLNPWTLALLVGGTTVGAVSAYADAQSKTIKGMASDLRELERLNARAAADPSDAILNARVGERTKKIIELRTEIERLSKAQAKANGPEGSVGSGDTALRRELARQEALNAPDKDAIANAAKAQKAALAEMSKALDTYNALVAKGTGYNTDYNTKLAELAMLQKAGKINTEQLTDARAKLEETQPYAIEQAKAWAEQTKISAKAVADSIADYDKYTDSLDKSADSVAAQVLKLQDEEQALTLAAAQNISLAQAIEQVTIARLSEAQAKEFANGNQEAGDAIKREIEQRKLLATALGSKEARDASIKSAKDAESDWKKAAEKINDSITDALLRGFESGKGFAENLRDTVTNMFKTMVLRPTVSAIVGGLTGFGGAANAATTATGLSDAGGLIGGVGQLTAIGTAFGEGFVSTLAGNSLTIAAQTATGGTLAGIGGAVGAAAPYVLAAAAVYALLTQEKNYVKSTGDAAVNFGSTGSVTSASDFKGQTYEANVSAAANKFVVDLNAEYLKAAKSLDLGAVASAFAFGSNDAGKFRVGGSAGGVGFDSGELDSSPEALKLAASRAVFAALQGSELPGYLSKAFSGLVADSASQGQIASAYQFAESLKAVRFGLLDAAAQQAEYQKIIDAGTASLSTSAATFKTDFIAAIDAGLTPEGLAQWSALGGTMQALEQITGKTTEGLKALGRSVADIANERTRLQDQYDTLALSGEDLLKKQKAALDESNHSLFDNIQAQTKKNAVDAEAKDLQDQLTALTETASEALVRQRNSVSEANRGLFDQVQAQIALKDATEKSTAALAAAASIRSSAQSAVLSNDLLNGSSPQAVALKGAQFTLENSIDAVRKLAAKNGVANASTITGADIEKAANNFGQYLGQSFTEEFAKLIADYYSASAGVVGANTALADAKTAASDKAIKDAEDAAKPGIDAALNIAKERAGLQEQYDKLVLNNVDLLAKQRAALDESNRALFDSINIETSRKSIADQSASLADRLAIANGTSTAREIALRKELEGALNASNAATIKAIYAAEDLATANTKATEKMRANVATALSTAGTAATNTLSGVQRAVDAQKKLVQLQVDTAQESVSNLTSIFDTLKSNIASLRGDVDSAAQQSAAQGGAFITQALATARSTGYLPDAGDLADAVSAAVAGVGSTVFASQADADFERLRLAGTLSALKDATGDQLTTAERQLEAAKDQLDTLDLVYENAKKQLDAANGINTSVLSVAAAVDAFTASLPTLLGALLASKTVEGTTGPRDTGGFIKQIPGGSYTLPSAPATTRTGTSYEAVVGLTAKFGTAYVNSIAPTLDDLYAAAKAAGIPGFSVGTNYVPKDMLARIHEGEAIVPKAYNPAAGGNARLESLVEGLTKEVQRLQSIVNDGNRSNERIATAVNGNPDVPMLVQTV